jgi:glutamate synthase (NADPH/NADH) small chain
VCPQERLCEQACILHARSDPVSIGAVEKFINEYAFAHGAIDVATAPSNGRTVAVIGAGPGGLACADELAKLGYAVTVFEALPSAGGLLVYGIPAFKLAKSVVARRVAILRRRGVRFEFHRRLGRDLRLDDLRGAFDAVFLAFGAQKSKPLDVPGAQLAGVHQAIPFLVQRNVDAPFDGPVIDVRGRQVVVLGGGDSAMDCLRTAIRCGGREVTCLYRRDLANMPGSRKEYDNALEEGAEFQFLTNPTALVGDATGHVCAVRCVRMELGAPDATGRRKPRPVAGSGCDVPADIVLAAYGFDPMPFPPESDLQQIATNEWGGVITDVNQMTSVSGVFAGGDLVRGANLVVNAVRDGRQAAVAIDRWLATADS